MYKYLRENRSVSRVTTTAARRSLRVRKGYRPSFEFLFPGILLALCSRVARKAASRRSPASSSAPAAFIASQTAMNCRFSRAASGPGRSSAAIRLRASAIRAARVLPSADGKKSGIALPPDYLFSAAVHHAAHQNTPPGMPADRQPGAANRRRPGCELAASWRRPWPPGADLAANRCHPRPPGASLASRG